MKPLPEIVSVNEHGNVIVPAEEKKPYFSHPASANLARLWAENAIKHGYDPNGVVFVNGKIRSRIQVRPDGSVHIHYA